MANLVDGKAIRNKILNSLKERLKSENLTPVLAIIKIGENEASDRYIRQKQIASQEIGAKVEIVSLSENVGQAEVESKIKSLNDNKEVKGIIIQLPIPEQLNKADLTELISVAKDVDGLNPDSKFKPATPLGVLEILKEHKVKIKGSNVVIFGRSELVGLPLKILLEQAGANVIQIHSQTPEPIDRLSLKGDILISAVGKAGLITERMVKQGAVVIDVGINKDPQTGKLVGDVDFKPVSQKASLITPVPGGVGPLTVAMLLSNLVEASFLDR